MESTIGRYRLLKRLASGGMGEVYLAAQAGAQGFQKFVALKRVAASAAADPELISLFLDEARLVATLSHRSIVQVYDLGQDEQGFFVSMEFVQGPSVRALLDRLVSQGQRLAPALALDIAAQVGDALACAYYSRAPDGTPLRIIHRDVSPRNILVSVSGDVKLIDFGIAQSMRQIGSSASPTGKLAYMSPEQLRSEPLNARSDLFSLGIVLCEMLGGENPFARTEPKELVLAIQRDEPKLPSVRDPALTPCDAVLKRLLAKLPSERFADGIELAEALAELRARFPKPPKRLGAVVSDLFGMEISELMREVSLAAGKAEPALPRSPSPTPAPATPRVEARNAGLGTDAGGNTPIHGHSPSVYSRVTMPYLQLPKEMVEVNQPELAVPKIVRSEPSGERGADSATQLSAAVEEAEKTKPESIPAEYVATEALGIQIAMPPAAVALELKPPPQVPLPSQSMPIDLPELKELADQKAAQPEPLPAAQAAPTTQSAAPQSVASGGTDFTESSWYKNSIPPGRAPFAALSAEEVKTPPAATVEPRPSEPPLSAATGPTPSANGAATTAQFGTPLEESLGSTSETTIPIVLPQTSRSRFPTIGLPLLALVAVAIGVAIGLYIVHDAPQTTGQPLPVVAPPVPEPTPTPAPLTPTPTPEPVAEGPVAVQPTPTPVPDLPKVDQRMIANPLEPLVAPKPEKPEKPERAVHERPERVARPVEQPRSKVDKPEDKPAKEPKATNVAAAEPKKEELSYQLLSEGLGLVSKVMTGSGAIRLGEADGMVVVVGFSVTAEGLKATLECQPWAIAAVNGLSVGRTPIPLDLKEQPTKIELRRPGAPAVNVQLSARKVH